MTPQICMTIFLVEGLRVDIRIIPNVQVPRPNGFFLDPLEKSIFWEKC